LKYKTVKQHLFYHNLSWFMLSVQKNKINKLKEFRQLKEIRQNSELVQIR